MKKLFLVILSLTCINLCGQDIRTATIRWSSEGNFNVNTGEDIRENTEVISYPDHIEWRTANGSLKYSLGIVETNGTWTNVSGNGQVIFEVNNQGRRGTVQFSRSAEEIKVKVMLLSEDRPDIFELTITNTELL